MPMKRPLPALVAASCLLLATAVCAEARPGAAAGTDPGRQEVRQDVAASASTSVSVPGSDKGEPPARRPLPREKDVPQQSSPASSVQLLEKGAQGLGCAE